MCDRSSVMPPRTGVTCPSSDVPAPHATTGTCALVTQRQQARRFLRRFDERHRVRQHRRLGVLAVRMVVAQRRIGGDALAHESAGGVDHGFDRAGHGRAFDGLVRWPVRLDPGCRAGKRGRPRRRLHVATSGCIIHQNLGIRSRHGRHVGSPPSSGR